MLYSCYHSLVFVASTADTIRGLKQTSNHYVNYNIFFHRQPIPIMAWTPGLITLFDHCKHHLVSSPLLLRYDSSKPVLFKTDWCAGGMGYILMQADDSPQCLKAIQILENTGYCLFDLSLDGPRLRPVFLSRSNHPYEKYYHSFVGEVTCVRWAISCCRKYLWGKKFYWFCDCVAVKEISEYTGNIHQLQRWYQELFGYEFAIIHRVTSMMKYVDGLGRYIDVLIHRYFAQAARMRADDVAQRPFVYSYDAFNTCSNPRRITTSNITIVTKLYYLLPALSITHHSLINFTSMYTVQSYSITPPTSHIFYHIIPPENMLWLSFDLIISSLASLLFKWPWGTVTPFSFETDITYHHIFSFISSSISPTYTTLSHLLYGLHLFKGLKPLSRIFFLVL